MFRVFGCVVRRDVLLAMRRRADVLTALAFFVLVVTLFPLGVGADPKLLRTIAPGVVWVAALLASMLTLPRLFSGDHADGSLDQMLLSASPVGVIVAGKLTAHWLIAGLPLVILSPLLALQFDLAAEARVALVWSLLAGTPILTLIGAIGAALTLGLRAGGLLLALLVLPLYVPVLVLGAGAVGAAAAGLDTSGHYMVLAAMLIAAAVLAPWAISAALRWASE